MSADHGHDIAAHCREPGHFASPVEHACKMCHEALRARIALLEKVVEAAGFLAPVLRESTSRDDYRGIFLLAHNHGMNYEGPTFHDELENLETALKAAESGGDMGGRNWIQDLRDDLEYNRNKKEVYLKAMVTAVSILFELGYSDKGKEVMKMAGLPIGETAAPPDKP